MTDDERHQLKRLGLTVFGNGRAGLDNRVEQLEKYMFANPATGEKGLVHTVTELGEFVHRLQNTLNVLNWLLGLIGVGGLVAAIRWFSGG